MTKLTDIQILIDTCMQMQLQLQEQLFQDEDAYKHFTFKETQDILESAGLLIDAYINENIMTFADPDFHEKVFENVELLLIQQFKSIIDDNEESDIYQEFIEILEKAFALYYKYIAPKRSSGPSFIRKEPNQTQIKKKIEYLQSIPQPDQRTDEWYVFRHKFLTASSIWKAFGTESSKNQLIYDKCKPLNIDKYKTVSTETPMHWGNKYEDVSIQLYEAMYQTKVSEFGCLPHPTIQYIAASPDGINTLPSSERYGRMLEVKNIVNREITGVPKREYWIQMQLQMEVCNLNECDFLETRFHEYETYEEFLMDKHDDADADNDHNDDNDDNNDNFLKTKDGKSKGMMMYFMKDGAPFYEYAPIQLASEDSLNEWVTLTMEKNENLSWMKNIYWKLDELSCVLVLRNKLWFKAAKPILDEFWEIIKKEKQNGCYEHRAPNKRKKAQDGLVITNIIQVGKCLIDISQFDSSQFDSC
jgi:putative phage-type endonuclease